MDLSIIIVSWNTKDLLQKCLHSIYLHQADLSLEVYVVDNNSSDQTVEMIRNDFPQVKLISNNLNFGFAKANNQAAKVAKGDYILLLNPDTEISPNSLSKAINYLKTHPNCGVLGAKLLNYDKTIQPSVRNFPTIWPIFLMLIKAPKFFKHLNSIDHYLKIDLDYTKIQSVDQVMGAFMMMSREKFKQIGYLDERFFIWFEEVDLCYRFKKSGQVVIYNPEIEIIHYGGQSFAQAGVIKKQFLFFKSACRYFLKNGLFNH